MFVSFHSNILQLGCYFCNNRVEPVGVALGFVMGSDKKVSNLVSAWVSAGRSNCGSITGLGQLTTSGGSGRRGTEQLLEATHASKIGIAISNRLSVFIGEI